MSSRPNYQDDVMDGPEHAVFGLFIGMGVGLLLGVQPWLILPYGVLGMLFALLPDVDIQTAEIRSWEISSFVIPFLIGVGATFYSNVLLGLLLACFSWFIWSLIVSTRGVLKHRGLSHSIGLYAILAIALLYFFGKEIETLFILSWGSHLVLDSPKKILLWEGIGLKLRAQEKKVSSKPSP